ncbi:odorant receptor 94b-like [Scaptodrosophila lebanonensis]|uniref:Odorant receptor n=1 Tax=Drosophila lebanonensis TaxID=7225 RepID=A0A6J2T3S7_DROLE|nr:odorant receptor 94b-like [Scaptodrosophila lebanonensis]
MPIMANSTDRIAAVRTLLKILCWIGLWKWQDETGFLGIIKRNLRFVIHLPLTITYLALMWLEALTSTDFEQAGQVLYMSLTLLTVVVKLMNIWQKRDMAWSFINELSCDPRYELNNRDELEYWQSEQLKFKRIFYTYMGCSFAAGCFGFFSVFLQETYELPFSYYVPFEWRNPERYYYAWGYDVLAMTLACATNIMLDTIGCYFMFHISLLYRLLGLRLEALQKTSDQEATLKLRQVFQIHARLFRLTHDCEYLVSPYVLSQVVLSAFIICFSGYRLIKMNWQESPGPFFTTIQFASLMVLQIFFPCYYGNELTIYADQLTNSVFKTNWLEFSVGTRKILIIYMEILKRPVIVRAGGFFKIGLPIFVKTMNNAFSFFALLLNLSER